MCGETSHRCEVAEPNEPVQVRGHPGKQSSHAKLRRLSNHRPSLVDLTTGLGFPHRTDSSPRGDRWSASTVKLESLACAAWDKVTSGDGLSRPFGLYISCITVCIKSLNCTLTELLVKSPSSPLEHPSLLRFASNSRNSSIADTRRRMSPRQTVSTPRVQTLTKPTFLPDPPMHW
ncbi:hypothetical protein BU16DRAFT_99089 [Lophium mytilinum]|uniref:Uncharacterized protein n=1 Tax=Lophium mytilinum TaxID=390894 RepID=A0A6A6QHQ5_9PEZI|nr:hypothetical protein BU16DRAFT_99089 [Lophium mytilinum]